MVECPTSELPICPAGKPTAAPDASSAVTGLDENNRSRLGVFACATALFTLDGFIPTPSIMISIVARRGTGEVLLIVVATQAEKLLTSIAGMRKK